MRQISEFSISEEICAVSIGKTEGTNTHCGLLYNTSIDGVRTAYFLHLGNPLHLYNESEKPQDSYPGYLADKNNFIWMPFNGIHISVLKLVRTKCIVIAQTNKALPYGVFHDEETLFDATGNLILGQDSNGLTCATFVKVVLKSLGINIIDDTDWPDERDEDVDWLKKMIEFYENDIKKLVEYGNDFNKKIKNAELTPMQKAMLTLDRTKVLTKIDTLKKTVREFKDGTKRCFKRYRPEEVSIACYNDHLKMPLKFEYAEEGKKGAGILGEELYKILPNKAS